MSDLDDELDDGNDLDDEYEDDFDDDTGNRIVGAVPRQVLDYVARAIVDDPEAVVVETDEHRGRVTLRLHVAPDDMGKVIGRNGSVAKALRTLLKVIAARDGELVSLEIG